MSRALKQLWAEGRVWPRQQLRKNKPKSKAEARQQRKELKRFQEVCLAPGRPKRKADSGNRKNDSELS